MTRRVLRDPHSSHLEDRIRIEDLLCQHILRSGVGAAPYQVIEQVSIGLRFT